MNLSMMREIDAIDPIGGLGPRVTPAPTPAPEPVRRPDGIVEHPDGKLSTDIPPPGEQPVWPFPSHAPTAWHAQCAAALEWYSQPAEPTA